MQTNPVFSELRATVCPMAGDLRRTVSYGPVGYGVPMAVRENDWDAVVASVECSPRSPAPRTTG